MHHPTVGGKVYAATGYGMQMMLAAGGFVVFGGIAYSLFGNLGSKTGSTRMFSTGMDALNKHPKTEINLGLPIKGFGEDHGGRHRRPMHKVYRKPNDAHTYTYLKFNVQGKKNDGLVHMEYANNELLYIIVEMARGKLLHERGKTLTLLGGSETQR